MKKFIYSFLIIVTALQLSFAQEITEEKSKSVNKSVGDTTYTTRIYTELDITPRNYMIVVNPLKFILFYNISFLAKVNENIVVGGGVQTPTIGGLTGFGVNAEMRYYPKGNNMRGFYIAPNISYNNIEADDGGTSPFTFGALIGWQWFPSDQFAMGLGIGADYYIGSVDGNNDDLDSYDGFAPALRFDIGFAW